MHIITIDDIKTAVINSGLNEWLDDETRENFIKHAWDNHTYGSDVCLSTMYKDYIEAI